MMQGDGKAGENTESGFALMRWGFVDSSKEASLTMIAEVLDSLLKSFPDLKQSEYKEFRDEVGIWRQE